MDNQEKAGFELMAGLFEANIRIERALFEQTLKVKAMDLTLKTLPDAKPRYDEFLAALRTPELVQRFDLGERLAQSRVD